MSAVVCTAEAATSAAAPKPLEPIKPFNVFPLKRQVRVGAGISLTWAATSVQCKCGRPLGDGIVHTQSVGPLHPLCTRQAIITPAELPAGTRSIVVTMANFAGAGLKDVASLQVRHVGSLERKPMLIGSAGICRAAAEGSRVHAANGADTRWLQVRLVNISTPLKDGDVVRCGERNESVLVAGADLWMRRRRWQR